MSFRGKTYSRRGMSGNPFDRMMREQCNKVVAAKSAGLIGSRFGSTGFSTVRHGDEQSQVKPKKFFKSRSENLVQPADPPQEEVRKTGLACKINNNKSSSGSGGRPIGGSSGGGSQVRPSGGSRPLASSAPLGRVERTSAKPLVPLSSGKDEASGRASTSRSSTAPRRTRANSGDTTFQPEKERYLYKENLELISESQEETVKDDFDTMMEKTTKQRGEKRKDDVGEPAIEKRRKHDRRRNDATKDPDDEDGYPDERTTTTTSSHAEAPPVNLPPIKLKLTLKPSPDKSDNLYKVVEGHSNSKVGPSDAHDSSDADSDRTDMSNGHEPVAIGRRLQPSSVAGDAQKATTTTTTSSRPQRWLDFEPASSSSSSSTSAVQSVGRDSTTRASRATRRNNNNEAIAQASSETVVRAGGKRSANADTQQPDQSVASSVNNEEDLTGASMISEAKSKPKAGRGRHSPPISESESRVDPFPDLDEMDGGFPERKPPSGEQQPDPRGRASKAGNKFFKRKEKTNVVASKDERKRRKNGNASVISTEKQIAEEFDVQDQDFPQRITVEAALRKKEAAAATAGRKKRLIYKSRSNSAATNSVDADVAPSGVITPPSVHESINNSELPRVPPIDGDPFDADVNTFLARNSTENGDADGATMHKKDTYSAFSPEEEDHKEALSASKADSIQAKSKTINCDDVDGNSVSGGTVRPSRRCAQQQKQQLSDKLAEDPDAPTGTAAEGDVTPAAGPSTTTRGPIVKKLSNRTKTDANNQPPDADGAATFLRNSATKSSSDDAEASSSRDPLPVESATGSGSRRGRKAAAEADPPKNDWTREPEKPEPVQQSSVKLEEAAPQASVEPEANKEQPVVALPTRRPLIFRSRAANASADKSSRAEAAAIKQDEKPVKVEEKPVATSSGAPAPKQRSFFKSKGTSGDGGGPRKALSLYRHNIGWSGDKDLAEETKDKAAENKQNPADIFDDFDDDFGPDTEPLANSVDQGESNQSFTSTKLTRVATYPTTNTGIDDDGEMVTQVKCPKSYKEFFTVIKNVKKAHEINDFGEFQEFNDDVDYIVDGLNKRHKMSLRCLTCISLASKCMKPNFRMHLRAHSIVSKFFAELKDAPQNPSLALCTSTVLFVLSQDRLNMDMDRDSLELMLNLLDTDSKIQDLKGSGLDERELAKNKQKVIDICQEMQKKGHAASLNIDLISADHLSMETLLSMTSKRAGEWFKEELRELGGLGHLARTLSDCISYLTVKNITTWTELLIDKLKKANRILRVLENVSHENEENCTYLLEYKIDGIEFISYMNRFFILLDHEIQLNPTTDLSDKESVGVAVRDAYLTMIRVLINLCHDHSSEAKGSLILGNITGYMDRVLRCLFIIPYWFVPLSKRFEVIVLALNLLINLVEHSCENRQTIMDCMAAQKELEFCVKEEPRMAIEDLVQLFLDRSELAKLSEEKTDNILDCVEEEVQEVDPKEEEKKSKTEGRDTMEETIQKLITKAGSNMESTIIAAYIGLAIGYIIQDSEDYESRVREYMPTRDFKDMAHMLEKLHKFMKMTASGSHVNNKSIKSTKTILQHLEKIDMEPEPEPEPEDESTLDFSFEMTRDETTLSDEQSEYATTTEFGLSDWGKF